MQNGYVLRSPYVGAFYLMRVENGQYDPAEALASWTINPHKECEGRYPVEILFDRSGANPTFSITIQRPPESEYEGGVPMHFEVTDTAVSSDFGGGRLGWYGYTTWEFDGSPESGYPFPVESERPSWGMDDLRVLADIAGDATRDGQTDDADLSVLLTHWAQGGQTWSTGDFSGNGTVDDADLSILLAHWAEGVSATVPEPATLALLALAPLTLRRRAR